MICEWAQGSEVTKIPASPKNRILSSRQDLAYFRYGVKQIPLHNMTTAAHIAQHFREFYKGRNWTWVWFEEVVKDISWKEATQKIGSFNTIAVLVYHMHYYVRLQSHVLKGGSKEGYDMDPFNAPTVQSAVEWKALLAAVFAEGEAFATLVESFNDEQLEDIFLEKRYGTVYRNLHGNIEHMHYHLGQIVLLKKMIREDT
jgi:uncharacterized damage-inducible protein DinB